MSSSNKSQSAVRIEPWGEGDLDILKKTLGDPAMTRFVGGPESDEQLIKRQAKFERIAEEGTGRMFKIIDVATGEAAGSVGYWDSIHNGEEIYEAGWFVIPAFQGKGIAGAATALAIARAREDGKHRFLHAFPSVENPPSNALCRKLGFTLVEECEFEYPKGHFMQCNDWRFDLLAGD
ncbi:GNAT family N-acetyltransferase [Ktedonospora formicarum]|uniref:N-acetyltransferase GCN5 n=1 Tax=Ktedonospora formicarum TaxID=2778364 RepID=A0A8J3I421_9CHLR|nr:GNAT family N-acetyltransferase [Ktedonospora formicarum]GHO46478.1 N-acetyltransferase GCN5 [Ktedonospora formicarum]